MSAMTLQDWQKMLSSAKTLVALLEEPARIGCAEAARMAGIAGVIDALGDYVGATSRDDTLRLDWLATHQGELAKIGNLYRCKWHNGEGYVASSWRFDDPRAAIDECRVKR